MLIVRSPEALAAGNGSMILACECRDGARAPSRRLLSIRTMRRGCELHCSSRGALRLDEDAYLVANAGGEGCAIYRGEGPIRAFAVFFDGRLLEQAGSSGDARFLECLRPHGDAVSARLRALEAAVQTATHDRRWLDEQVLLLLQEAIEGEQELRRRARRIDCVKPATRDELFRRVLLAADFIQSHYDQAITLDDIARAARLSRYHLLRLFRSTHGATPHAFLLAKRLAVANRMLFDADCDLSEIAERCGFGTRSSLFRHLRKQRGAGGRGLRAQQPPPSSACRITA